eukprot:TRINITY_DN61705_c0_g1_i1.p1 TRINITY_DN61705_c0_g1~~TRINITY_DN61705_c0_g1_i1.p1  ORF type:complete len:247 (+),score=21.14 TRINITY_DN61705_c0_g1_i1:118-858(+)
MCIRDSSSSALFEPIEAPAEILCSVCLELPDAPQVLLPCGHTFCSTCQEGLTTCPDCRLNVDEDRGAMSIEQINILTSIQGVCSVCQWRGSYVDFRNMHTSTHATTHPVAVVENGSGHHDEDLQRHRTFSNCGGDPCKDHPVKQQHSNEDIYGERSVSSSDSQRTRSSSNISDHGHDTTRTRNPPLPAKAALNAAPKKSRYSPGRPHNRDCARPGSITGYVAQFNASKSSNGRRGGGGGGALVPIV